MSDVLSCKDEVQDEAREHRSPDRAVEKEVDDRDPLFTIIERTCGATVRLF